MGCGSSGDVASGGGDVPPIETPEAQAAGGEFPEKKKKDTTEGGPNQTGYNSY